MTTLMNTTWKIDELILGEGLNITDMSTSYRFFEKICKDVKKLKILDVEKFLCEIIQYFIKLEEIEMAKSVKLFRCDPEVVNQFLNQLDKHENLKISFYWRMGFIIQPGFEDVFKRHVKKIKSVHLEDAPSANTFLDYISRHSIHGLELEKLETNWNRERIVAIEEWCAFLAQHTELQSVIVKSKYFLFIPGITELHLNFDIISNFDNDVGSTALMRFLHAHENVFGDVKIFIHYKLENCLQFHSEIEERFKERCKILIEYCYKNQCFLCLQQMIKSGGNFKALEVKKLSDFSDNRDIDDQDVEDMVSYTVALQKTIAFK